MSWEVLPQRQSPSNIVPKVFCPSKPTILWLWCSMTLKWKDSKHFLTLNIQNMKISNPAIKNQASTHFSNSKKQKDSFPTLCVAQMKIILNNLMIIDYTGGKLLHPKPKLLIMMKISSRPNHSNRFLTSRHHKRSNGVVVG
eukprot:Sdes_comp18703_c0_seq2m9010